MTLDEEQYKKLMFIQYTSNHLNSSNFCRWHKIVVPHCWSEPTIMQMEYRNIWGQIQLTLQTNKQVLCFVVFYVVCNIFCYCYTAFTFFVCFVLCFRSSWGSWKVCSEEHNTVSQCVLHGEEATVYQIYLSAGLEQFGRTFYRKTFSMNSTSKCEEKWRVHLQKQI